MNDDYINNIIVKTKYSYSLNDRSFHMETHWSNYCMEDFVSVAGFTNTENYDEIETEDIATDIEDHDHYSDE